MLCNNKSGLYFSIAPAKLHKSDIFSTFESIHRLLTSNIKTEELKNSLKADMSQLANSYYYNYRPSPRTLRHHRILKNLRNNTNLVITKPDKGNGVVILDRSKYNDVILKIISDKTKFEEIASDPTFKRESSLQRYLRKLKQKNFFTDEDYHKLYPCGSTPARIYGLPKMHKFSPGDDFPKLRPIVSSIGTYNYNLAQHLCKLLSPCIPSDYSCKDTFSFLSS